jgi:hypothetical protein
MENVEDLDGLLLNSVGHNVWKAGKYQFASSFLASNSTTMRGCFQRANGLVKFKDSGFSKLRIVLGEIVLNVF